MDVAICHVIPGYLARMAEARVLDSVHRMSLFTGPERVTGGLAGGKVWRGVGVGRTARSKIMFSSHCIVIRQRDLGKYLLTVEA